MNKALNLVGLATRAGKVRAGAALCEKAVKSGEAALLLIAEDAAENTKEKFSQMADYYETEFFYLGTCELLGKFSGKAFRSVLCVTDDGFAGAIKKLL